MRLRTVQRGFTLIELLVVVALLVALAGLVLPKLDRVLLKNNKGIAGNNLGGVARYVQTYRIMHNVYPDGFDSLMNAAGTAEWNPGNQATGTKGLDPQLFGGSDGIAVGDGKLKVGSIADDNELRSLVRMGITTVHDIGSVDLPGDAFNATPGRALAIGSKIAEINWDPATSTGNGDAEMIYKDAYPQTGGVPPSGRKLVAFGFGPLNNTIGDVLMECPTYNNAANPNIYYNRNLVVFEIGAGKRAELKAVLGADGDRIREEIADYYEQ